MSALTKYHRDLFYSYPIRDGINDSVHEFMQIMYRVCMGTSSIIH